MVNTRFSSWKEDHPLKGAMEMYVKQGLKREEAIDFFARTAFLNKPRVSNLSTDLCVDCLQSAFALEIRIYFLSQPARLQTTTLCCIKGLRLRLSRLACLSLGGSNFEKKNKRPLFLGAYCPLRPQFLCAHCFSVLAVPLCLMFHCAHCSSVPNVLCVHCSSVPTVLCG